MTESNGIHADELKRQQEINDSIIKSEGGENQYKLHEELGKVMTDNVTVVRYSHRLQATDDKDRRTAGALQKDLDQRFESMGDAGRAARPAARKYV